MIERAGAYAYDYTLHGGHGDMRMQWHFFDASRLPVAVQTWELPPGATEGLHTHDPDHDSLDEFYLVLAGTARMHVDDAVYDLAPGDSVMTPAGTSHDLVNTGPDTLRALVVWGRPGEADWSGFGSARAARRARDESGQGTSPMSSAQTSG